MQGAEHEQSIGRGSGLTLGNRASELQYEFSGVLSAMSDIAGSAEPARTVHRSSLSPSRALDLAVAIAGVTLLSPIMALIALAILIETGRPIFYSQVRLGLKGRHFRIYKFRKFHKNCSPTGLPLTMKNDSRMTRLGGFLAWTKFDELPQFWNVIKGDMALVGPRPETVDFADCFAGAYRSVLDYKPGIFGPSQTLFRDESSRYPVGLGPDRVLSRCIVSREGTERSFILSPPNDNL